MKYLTLIAILLLSGCAQYIHTTETPLKLPDGSVVVLKEKWQWNSAFKNFRLGEAYSESQSMEIEVTAMPVPKLKGKAGD